MQFWHDHSMMIVLITLLVIITVYLLWAGRLVWLTETSTSPLDYSEFWVWWSTQYLFSIIADFFGAAFFVLATKHLREKGSPETGDDDDSDNEQQGD